MGKLVQFQTSAVNMVLSLREQLRRSQLCILDEFDSPSGRLIVSDLEWPYGRVRATEDQLNAIDRREPFNSDIFIDQLPGKRVQIVQPARVSLSTIQQMVQAGAAKPAVLQTIDLDLIFNVQVSSVDDDVSLRIALTAIEGAAAAPPQSDALRSRILGQFPATSIPIDTARLAGFETQPKVANVGIAAVVADSMPTPVADPQAHVVPLPTESMIVVRIEIGNPPTDTTAWQQFFSNPASALFATGVPRARSWAIFTEEFFVREGIARGTEKSLKKSDKFELQGGLASAWTAPDAAHAHVHLDFYGRAIEACGPLSIRMSVNVRIELSIVPAGADATLNPAASPGTLHQFVKINHWKNDLDAALCLTAAKAIWPYLGPRLMDEDHLTWFELVLSFLLPPATTYFLLKLANKGGLLPAPLPSCVRPDPEKDEFNCTRPFDADLVAIGARPLLEGMQASAQGLMLRGTFTWFRRLGRAFTLASLDATPFRLSASNSACNFASPTGLALANEHPELFVEYEAFAAVNFEPTPPPEAADPAGLAISTGATLNELIPAQICSVRVRPEDDPLNVFAPHVTLSGVDAYGGRITLRVPVASVPDVYFTPAYNYPCRVLVQTTVGSRIISFQPPVKATEEETKDAAVSTWAKAVGNCYAKSKAWDPKWLIDPSDYYREEHQWEVLVRGLRPLEQVALDTADGRPVALTAADRQGSAILHAVLRPDTYDGRLAFRRSAASERLPDADTEAMARTLAARQHPIIDARQSQLLLVAELPLDDETVDVTPGVLDGRRVLAVTSRDAVTLYDLRQLSNPTLLARTAVPGVAGVVQSSRRLLAWGRRGTFDLRFLPDAGELLADAASPEPVLDAAQTRDGAILLRGASIQVIEAGRQREVALENVHAHCLAAGRSHVLVGGTDAVHVFDYAVEGLRLRATHAIGNVTRILGPAHTHDSRFVVEAGDDTELVDAAGEGVTSIKMPSAGPSLRPFDAGGMRFFRRDRSGRRLQLFAVGRVAWQ